MNPDLPQTAALGIIFIPKKIKDYRLANRAYYDYKEYI